MHLLPKLCDYTVTTILGKVRAIVGRSVASLLRAIIVRRWRRR